MWYISILVVIFCNCKEMKNMFINFIKHSSFWFRKFILAVPENNQNIIKKKTKKNKTFIK